MRPEVVACAILLCALPGPTRGLQTAPDGAREIMARSEEATEAHAEQVAYRMELIESDGTVAQTRTMESYFLQAAGSKSTLLKFREPPVVEDTGMLLVDREEAPSEIWVYLPVTRRLRRVSDANKGNRFLGTEFAYEDFEDYQLDAYRFELRETDACAQGRSCRVIQATPEASTAHGGYHHKLYWIEQESLYPVRIDYVRADGSVAKRLTVRDLRRRGRYWRPERVLMENLDTGRATRLVEESRDLDGDLDPYFVSSRFLRSG